MVAAGLKQKQPQFPQNSCDMSTPTLPTPVRILHLTPPLQEPESNKSPETPKEHERWEEDRAASGHLQGKPDPPTRGKPGLLFPLWAAGGTALCGGSQRPIKLIHSLPPPPPHTNSRTKCSAYQDPTPHSTQTGPLTLRWNRWSPGGVDVMCE